jgi:hypothetical protein
MVYIVCDLACEHHTCIFALLWTKSLVFITKCGELCLSQTVPFRGLFRCLDHDVKGLVAALARSPMIYPLSLLIGADEILSTSGIAILDKGLYRE